MGRPRLIDGNDGEADDLGDDAATIVSVVTQRKSQPIAAAVEPVAAPPPKEAFSDADVDAALSVLDGAPPGDATAVDARAYEPPVTPPRRVSQPVMPAQQARVSQPVIPAQQARVSQPVIPAQQMRISQPVIPAQPAYDPAYGGYAPQPAYPPSGVYQAAPGYPPSGAYIAPEAILVRPPRSKLLLATGGIALLALVVGGVAIGMMFGRSSGEKQPVAAQTPPQPAPTQPPQPVPPQPAPPQPAAVAAKQPPVTPEPPPHAPAAKGDITSLAHPMLESVTSPLKGDVALVALAQPREVKAGEKLFAIRAKRPRSAKVAELARKVTELEGLAQQDPAAYKPFLLRARRDLERAQPSDLTPITAAANGFVESRVKVGDKVEAGAVLGAVLDARTWTAVATIEGAVPTANWSCAVASPDDKHTAACKILSTEAGQGGTRVTVEITASTAPWLVGLDQHPRIVVEP